MYLREMGSVELLSREGEIAIAKRIEAGRELMIGALCESPLTFEALTVWRDELNEGKVLLRDIIDLEAMYGAGPDGPPAPVPPPVGPDGKPLHRRGEPPPSQRRRREFKKPEPPKPAAPSPRPSPRRPKARKAMPAKPPRPPTAADGDDFDDEGNLPLSAMEAALKPQVLAALDTIAGLYKKLGKLQDARVEAALAVGRTLHRPGTPLQEAAQRDHGPGQVAQAQQQPHRSPGRPDVRHQPAPGRRWKASCCAWPKAMAWIAPISSSSISATSSIPTGRAASAA